MNRTIVIVSGFLDASVQEYQPDATFKMFKSLEQLDDYLQTGAIRATIMYVTSDVITSANTSLSRLVDITSNNAFFKADAIQYLTEPGEENTKALRYLIAENNLDNWQIVECTLNRAFVNNYINGTIDVDEDSVHKKAIYRRPRAEYIKQSMRNNPTLDESYKADEQILMNIPDVEVPQTEIRYSEGESKIVTIAGCHRNERTAFALLTAQYYALTAKTLIVESDEDYHLLTEYVTKSDLTEVTDYYMVTVSDLYSDLEGTLDKIRESAANLIIVGCIRREPYSYDFFTKLLMYLLDDCIDYFVFEKDVVDISPTEKFTLVVRDTVIGCLEATANLPLAGTRNGHFVGVNLQDIPDIHLQNGTVMSTILSDLLSTNDIVCPVVTITSLRLATTAYDLGALL